MLGGAQTLVATAGELDCYLLLAAVCWPESREEHVGHRVNNNNNTNGLFVSVSSVKQPSTGANGHETNDVYWPSPGLSRMDRGTLL